MATVTRIKVLRKELARLGYTYEETEAGGVAYTQFVSPRGKKWLYRDDAGTFPMPYASASFILNSKIHSMDYVKRHKGVRVPASIRRSMEYRTVADYRQVLGLSERVPLVVKPTDETLSHGVTVGIRNDDELKSGFAAAEKYSHNIIVQEEVQGEEFRFTFIGGELRSVICKQKPQVVGDGETSIRNLILLDNQQRMSIASGALQYPLLSLESITRFGVDIERIPARDEVVILGSSTLIENGASYWERIDEIHDSYKVLARRMAEDFGDGYLAVDILLQNYKEPQSDTNYCFLEFNNLPAMMLFYSCRNGQQTNIGRDLAVYLDKILHTVSP